MHIQKNDPIRILIVDDHPVVCAGLASMLAGHEEFEVVGSVASGERALAVIRQAGPAVILLDLRMPGMDGIAVLHALKSMASPPHALVLTSFEKDEDIYRAIRAGAAGYLLKDTTDLPSGVTRTHVTLCVCPANVRNSRPLARSHSLTVLSSPPDASHPPSGEKAIALTEPE